MPRPGFKARLWVCGADQGSSDPERVSFRSESLLNLLLRGFNLLPDPFSGPSWLNSEYYDVAATLPPGTTVDRFKEMLRNLLVQRFGLTFHYMTKDFTVYRIVVGKGGLKMKESPIDPNFHPSARLVRPRSWWGWTAFPSCRRAVRPR